MNSFGYLAFCLVFLMSFASSLISEDKENGIMDRLAISPTKSIVYYFQYLMAFTCISFLQIITVLLILPLISNVKFGNSILDLVSVVGFCTLFSLSCTSIGIVIHRYAPNVRSANVLSSMITLPLLMLGGCMWPIANTPKIMQVIAEFMPTFWFMEGIEKILYQGSIFAASSEQIKLVIFSIVLIGLTVCKKYQKT